MFWEAQSDLSIIQWLARGLIIYLWIFFIARIMGQREVGQVSLFDFIVSIIIGSVAATPLASSANGLLGPLANVTLLGGVQVLTAVIALKNSKLRRILEGEPLVLVQNGKLLEDTMRKARYNLDDLLNGLRRNKILSLSDVEFAILEPTGKLSVIPKSQARPLTPSDLNVPTQYEGLTTVLIEDGNVLEDNLGENELDKEWLQAQLEQYGISDPNDVSAALLDTKGRLYVSRKGQRNEQAIH